MSTRDPFRPGRSMIDHYGPFPTEIYDSGETEVILTVSTVSVMETTSIHRIEEILNLKTTGRGGVPQY